jgi:hypothetical protein
MMVSLLAYRFSGRIPHPSLHSAVAHVSAVLLFLSIGFGALLVYPLAYFRGATPGERILASLFTPLLWTLKEIIRVGEFFTFWESLYYGLNSLFLLTFFGTFGLMGLCELICRVRAKKKGIHPGPILTPLPVTAILLSLVALYVLLIWGTGVHWFYIYMEGYKYLFL